MRVAAQRPEASARLCLGEGRGGVSQALSRRGEGRCQPGSVQERGGEVSARLRVAAHSDSAFGFKS